MPSDAHAETPSVVAIDTSALLRFLHLGRTDLLKRHPRAFVTTGTVKGEAALYGQLAEYERATSRYHFSEVTLSQDEEELRDDMILVKGQGPGESSIIAIARTRGYGIALQDKGAIRFAKGLSTELGRPMPILRVENIFAELVLRGALTVGQVDDMLRDLAQNHKFRLKVRSIAEVL